MKSCILFLFTLVIIWFITPIENFVSYVDQKFTLDYNDSGYKIDYKDTKKLSDEESYDYMAIHSLDPNRQKYLRFLGRLNDKFKESMPITGSFRGTCDDNLNERIKKKVVSDVFFEFDQQVSNTRPKYKREVSKKDKSKTLDCVGISSELCETTNPYFYLIDSPYFPPPWTLDTYKDIDYPKNTNLTCFNKNFDCCKSSLD